MVSVIIPVLNKLEFTIQCLDRIWRHSGERSAYEVVIVDNGSSDGTARWFQDVSRLPGVVRYHRNQDNLGFAKGNNIGARLARGDVLLFLNNDTLVQPGWLTEMLRVSRSDSSIGIVGIKQLFPYTNTIYHTGVVFAPGGVPQHLYPHLDASLPYVNKEREYQAVTGACLLISKRLFEECGGFDEAYVNGYEDTDLCMAVRERGRKVVCCTSAFIYHYGQISEGRTAADTQNAARFASKWGSRVRVDQADYIALDRIEADRGRAPSPPAIRSLASDCIYFADDLGQGSAQTWVNAELALALLKRGVPTFVNGANLSRSLASTTRERLTSVAISAPVGGIQIKWSHYRPQHLNLELTGDINLEIFVINYLFGSTDREPWDYWLQCLRQNHHDKLPVSDFCQSVLYQLGVPEHQSHVVYHGYSPEVLDVEPLPRRSADFRFLTVTNSHDLGRYNTLAIIDAYLEVFSRRDEVTLVVKDYGASSGDTTLRQYLAGRTGGPRVEYVDQFTDKRELIRLYKSCDAFVSAHRGEGFGMKILDAMACGLPVITPLFGGPTSYCRPDNCLPVDFSLVPMGACLDTQSLAIANRPLWAEASRQSLAEQMRRVREDARAATAIAQRAREEVVARFSWDGAAARLMDVSDRLRASRPMVPRNPRATSESPRERSPYWLGLRVSVVIPTHNRKAKLLRCLDYLTRQSVLPQEFEVVVVDDGSTDGTDEAIQDRARTVPFQLQYVRQDATGPGIARNLGVEKAGGELVLFIGDDILADERLLEEHLVAHAGNPNPGLAVLGHIDWPDAMPKNAVMEYVCGDAMLQFAYGLIPQLPTLDHRFFYTSNISLKRQFLLDAAAAGIRFDPCFRHAAFEDSEFAFRLAPRGLDIRYAERALAWHDHPLDLESFASRECRAGEMAVIFYRKHPSQDPQLQVSWLADLSAQLEPLLGRPEFLAQLDTFDRQSDGLLRGLAGSLEGLLALEQGVGANGGSITLSSSRIRSALNDTLRMIFDVERTRGKVREWFSSVGDPSRVCAAQSLATVRRKLEFFSVGSGALGSSGVVPPLAGGLADGLKTVLEGHNAVNVHSGRVGRRLTSTLRAVIARPVVIHRLLRADRSLQGYLNAPGRQAWLAKYQRLRSRIRGLLTT